MTALKDHKHDKEIVDCEITSKSVAVEVQSQ